MSLRPMSATIAAAPDLIDAVRRLAPLIEASREESERERTLPAPLVSAMIAAGLHRIYVPRSLGGREADPHRS